MRPFDQSADTKSSSAVAVALRTYDMQTFRHLDLFSGIGGFALAVESIWGGSETIEHIFCDIEPFSQAVLRKHWPESMIYGDIRSLTADAEIARKRGLSNISAEKRQRGQHSYVGRSAEKWCIDLLTGGFPCQPFSNAGKRRGTEDDRHLWPEMLRVIREFHPRWIIGENVGGFVTWNGGMVLEQVHTDLENEGYEVQAFIIPACALNAPHRRDRIWIVAHKCDTGLQGGQQSKAFGKGTRTSRPTSERDSDAPNAASKRGAKRPLETERARSQAKQKRPRVDAAYAGCAWSESWPQVAARLCTLDDGLPGGLARPDGSGDAKKRTLSRQSRQSTTPRPRGWRNAALKGAGNSIVPQVAAEIMRAIKYSERI